MQPQRKASVDVQTLQDRPKREKNSRLAPEQDGVTTCNMQDREVVCGCEVNGNECCVL